MKKQIILPTEGGQLQSRPYLKKSTRDADIVYQRQFLAKSRSRDEENIRKCGELSARVERDSHKGKSREELTALLADITHSRDIAEITLERISRRIAKLEREAARQNT